jgi:hypothetical protein
MLSPSVRLYLWNGTTPTGRIFAVFHVCEIFDSNLTTYNYFCYNRIKLQTFHMTYHIALQYVAQLVNN